jgi:hypothetical protein
LIALEKRRYLQVGAELYAPAFENIRFATSRMMRSNLENVYPGTTLSAALRPARIRD